MKCSKEQTKKHCFSSWEGAQGIDRVQHLLPRRYCCSSALPVFICYHCCTGYDLLYFLFCFDLVWFGFAFLWIFTINSNFYLFLWCCVLFGCLFSVSAGVSKLHSPSGQEPTISRQDVLTPVGLPVLAVPVLSRYLLSSSAFTLKDPSYHSDLIMTILSTYSSKTLQRCSWPQLVLSLPRLISYS